MSSELSKIAKPFYIDDGGKQVYIKLSDHSVDRFYERYNERSPVKIKKRLCRLAMIKMLNKSTRTYDRDIRRQKEIKMNGKTNFEKDCIYMDYANQFRFVIREDTVVTCIYHYIPPRIKKIQEIKRQKRSRKLLTNQTKETM